MSLRNDYNHAAIERALDSCSGTLRKYISQCINDGEKWTHYKIKYAAKNGVNAARLRFDRY